MRKKIEIVRQRDIKDCGPCALQSIIKYYGGYVSLEKIRQDAYTSGQGTTVYHLLIAAKKYGFDAIAKKSPDKKLNCNLPCIVHVKYETGLVHFMSLYKISSDEVLLMDPAKGKVKMKYEEFTKIFTGVFIELYPKNKIIFLEKESSIYKLFFNIVKNNKKLCLNVFLVSIILTIFTILSGFYFKVGFEMISNNIYLNSLNYVIYLFLIATILKVVFEFLKNYYENHLNKNIDVSILGDFINHIFNLPLKVISSRSSGEIITRVNEIGSIKDLFSQIFITSLMDLILSLAAVIILYNINDKLVLIILLFIILYVLINCLISPYFYQRIKRNLDYQTILNTSLIENIEMISSLKNLSRTNDAVNALEVKCSDVLLDNYTFSQNLNSFNAIKNMVSELMVFVVNTVGFYLIYKGALSYIDLILFNTLMYYFIDPIKNIVSLIPKFNFLRASFNKICDFVDLPEEKVGEIETFESGNVNFQNVSFTYNEYKEIINDLTLVIKKSEKVMLKGASGSGKSTLCQLLQRNFNPTSGSILINGKNILDYSIATIRKNITYVGQKEKLYTDTILNNILFYKEKGGLFDKVCEVCCIDDIVSKKAFRYDSLIENGQINLSGGEKQRIILARALLDDSKILILDEALSETDYNLERTIIQNIKREFSDKTLIYVSHKKQDDLFDRVINIGQLNAK